MAYQVGFDSAKMITSEVVFGVDPKTYPVPGGIRRRVMSGFDKYYGYKKSSWLFAGLTLAQLRYGLAVCVSVAGTGTVAATAGTKAVVGTTTAFDTELETGDVLLFEVDTGIYEVATVATIADATHLTVVDNLVNDLSGDTFRYRHSTIYSGTCYVTVRDELDFWKTWSAIARFPDPEELGKNRSGEVYQNVLIEFVLISIIP